MIERNKERSFDNNNANAKIGLVEMVLVGVVYLTNGATTRLVKTLPNFNNVKPFEYFIRSNSFICSLYSKDGQVVIVSDHMETSLKQTNKKKTKVWNSRVTASYQSISYFPSRFAWDCNVSHVVDK